MAVHRPWPFDAGKSKAERQPAPNAFTGFNFIVDDRCVHRFRVAESKCAPASPLYCHHRHWLKKTNKPCERPRQLPKTISNLGKSQRPGIRSIADRVNVGSEGDRGLQRSVDGGFVAAFLSKGPNLSRKIRHWLDDEEDVPRNEYELIECAAGSRLHLINRKNGDLLGSRHNDLIHDFKAENFFRSLLNQDSFRGHHGKS
jgi:hypothetical protein